MKKLYVVRNAHTGAPVLHQGELIGFTSKQVAKEYRDILKRQTGEEFVASYGPDHKKWSGA